MLLLLAPGVLATLNCPTGYSSLNDEKCIQIINKSSSRQDAITTCSAKNGQLISISNIFENNALLSLLQSGQITQPLWLGMKCATSLDTSSCFWDDKTGSSSGYSNFASGFPNVDIGSCVYLQTTGKLLGKWISGDCDSMTMVFACESNEVAPVTCTNEFNDYCYFPTQDTANETQAKLTCEQFCADLVSIHSNAENDYVASLFSNSSATFVRLGGTYDEKSNLAWVDNTKVNYTNFGINNPTLGACLSMSLTNEIITEKQWITSHCDKALPYVCKRPLSERCQTTSTTTTITIQPKTADQCTSPTFFDNFGNFYSPSWPDSYVKQKTSCFYILTTPEGTMTKILFTTLSLDANSRIELFNEIEDDSPFQILSGVQTAATYYISTTNTLKMIFRTNGDQVTAGSYKWSAEFSYDLVPGYTTRTPIIVTPDPTNPSGCNVTSLSAPGQITSPNYPANYPNNSDCLYHLTASNGYKIALIFEEVSTEECCDIIVVHDGPNISDRELGRVSGYAPADTLHFVSSTNSMLVTFSTDSSTTSTGFKATFEAITVV